MQPSRSSRLAKHKFMEQIYANMVFKKTRCTLRVSIRRMWKPRVAARQLFQLVLPPSGDSKTISD